MSVVILETNFSYSMNWINLVNLLIDCDNDNKVLIV